MAKRNHYYESMMKGLEEALEDSKRKKKQLRRSRVILEIAPIVEYSQEEVKTIRHQTGMTQKEFAAYLGVSEKTVEAWECGTNTPSGSSSRLLSMFKQNKNLAQEYPFVIRRMQ